MGQGEATEAQAKGEAYEPPRIEAIGTTGGAAFASPDGSVPGSVTTKTAALRILSAS